MTLLTAQDYAAGYHHAWEVYLHERRQWHRDHNLTYTSQQEDQELAVFLQTRKLTCNMKTACSICQHEIAEAVFEGRDPFACPEFVRQKIKDMGFDVGEFVAKVPKHPTTVPHNGTQKKLPLLWSDLGIIPK